MVQPSGEGAIRCMQQAMATVDAKIDYINAHGTSTPVGDTKELEALRAVFGQGKVPQVSSTKSLTGHALGAAGVNEAIYSLLMMEEGFLSASANITELDPDATDIPIVREFKDNVTLNTIMSNSFGFGGTNATLIFQRYNG
jgi:3-oxoacyl-[acyl-carrier-protein] synthase-1